MQFKRAGAAVLLALSIAGGFALSALTSAFLWLYAALLGGLTLIVFGVFVLYGSGVALICAGVALLLLAVLIFWGIRNA